jgi:hypothetical protein
LLLFYIKFRACNGEKEECKEKVKGKRFRVRGSGRKALGGRIEAAELGSWEAMEFGIRPPASPSCRLYPLSEL